MTAAQTNKQEPRTICTKENDIAQHT